MNRFKNKAFIMALISGIVLLIQQLGFTFIPDNFNEIVTSVLGIFMLLGIVVDPTTPGISDK